MTNQKNKSFILHTDGLDIIDQLSDQQAGKLFKAIVSYQKTGEITKLDQTNTIILTPLIKQFKRDEEKYHQSILQGKLGNLKKYHKEIYEKVIKREISLEDGEMLAYPEKSIKSILSRPPINHDQPRSHNININTNINSNTNNYSNDSELKKQFEEIYRLYNKEKKLKVIPFDKLKTKFQSCLKDITFEELEQSVNDYLSYLSTETWRKKKAFDAWINSPEFYANDWKNESKEGKNLSQSNRNECTVDFINNIAKHTLLTKIIVSASNKAQIWFKDKVAYDKYQNLPDNLKTEIKNKIASDLSTNGFEPKF